MTVFAPPPRVLRARTRGRGSSSLAGAWSGEYAYAVFGRGERVPFNALLGETGGALSGSIDEPNTFGDPSAARLFAHVDGERAGTRVRFTKTYDGSGGQTHSVFYEGEANAALTRIDGVWRVSWLRGTFFMERADAAVEIAEEGAAETGA